MLTNEQFLQQLQDEFESHVIPFWEKLADPERGGFYGVLDNELVLHKDADRGCILNSRILWFFANLYLTFRKQEYLDFAKIAYDALQEHFLDKEYGGVFWSVTADGAPAETLKHTYNQAFAIYGLASYYEASGDSEALALAWNLFQVIESRCRDTDGYLEAYTREFGPMENDKLSENGVMATRTMNTLLHVMEAYTELYRVARDEEDAFQYEIRNEVGSRICEILHIFRDEIYNSERRRMEVFFDGEYNTLIDLYSYGHDIETAWLIDRTIEVMELQGTEFDLGWITEALTAEVYRSAYDGYRPTEEDLLMGDARANGVTTESNAEAAMEGSDKCPSEAQPKAHSAMSGAAPARYMLPGQIGHALPAECENGVNDESRVWWIQCEAIVGFLNGYQKSGDAKYLVAAKEIWEFLAAHMVDRREGSCWYGYLRPDGTPNPDKCIADEWTCPYHSGRMWLEVLKRLA